MNKKLFIGLAAAVAMSALTACSESSSSSKPSKAEECANGLSAECLVGAWNMNGFANSGTGEMLPNFNYTAAPGKMTFNEDGTFQFDVPAGAPAGHRTEDCNPIYGNWSVAGTTLTMRATINEMCVDSHKKKIDLVPKIVVDGVEVKMTYGSLWLLENATDEVSIKDNSTEVYTISAQ